MFVLYYRYPKEWVNDSKDKRKSKKKVEKNTNDKTCPEDNATLRKLLFPKTSSISLLILGIIIRGQVAYNNPILRRHIQVP